MVPPTRTVWSMSCGFSFASLSACCQGFFVFSIIGAMICSNCALVSFSSRCFGSLFITVIYGRLMSVCSVVDSSIFAFSAASKRRWSVDGSFFKSVFCCFLNSATRKSTIALSISDPPSLVSPLVDRTSKTPSPTSMRVMSKVPPPKS